MPHQAGQLRHCALPAQQAHWSNVCFLLTVSIIQENQESCFSPQPLVSGLGKTAPASSSYLHLAHFPPIRSAGRAASCGASKAHTRLHQLFSWHRMALCLGLYF